MNMLAAAWAGAALLAGAAVRSYPLDERSVCTIRIGRDEPTTCVFPGAVSALEGANLSVKPEDAPPVLLSYQAGASYFSVRATQPDAAAAANVLFRGRIFALRFQTGGEPDRTVTFLDAAAPAPAPEALRALVARARNFDHTVALYPALVPAIAYATPRTVTAYRDFSVTLEAVYRFEAEDTLVFRIRLTNPGATGIAYDQAGLGVRTGRDLHPASLAEGAGYIPPRGSALAYFAITGAPGGGRANLPVDLPFTVMVARVP